MVDAEIAEGEIGPLTQAIQNALRGPAPPPVQRLAIPTRQQDFNGATIEPEDEGVEDESLVTTPSDAPRQRAVRKPAATPEVLELDLITEPSLAGFATAHKAESHLKRFLVIAAWFKEHRGLDAITPAHVYTAYRHLKWPLNVNDFAQPLRDLKANKVMTSPERGTYAINHLGLQEVAGLSSGAG
jgi:hypothetical protein